MWKYDNRRHPQRLLEYGTAVVSMVITPPPPEAVVSSTLVPGDWKPGFQGRLWHSMDHPCTCRYFGTRNLSVYVSKSTSVEKQHTAANTHSDINLPDEYRPLFLAYSVLSTISTPSIGTNTIFFNMLHPACSMASSRALSRHASGTTLRLVTHAHAQAAAAPPAFRLQTRQCS